VTQRQIAGILRCDESYISNIKKGIKPPPTFQQCNKIADKLKLKAAEKKMFLFAAFMGRIKNRDKGFLDIVMIMPKEDAVNNPVITGGGNSFFEKVLKDKQIDVPKLMHCLSNLTPEKIKRLKELCEE
jgi:transcriptional regulator with XRE-family HTH domain